MPAQRATTVIDQDAVGSFLDILVHDFLPVVVLAAGLMAVTWVACAVIVIAGYLIGAVVVSGVRALVDTCVRHVRRRKGLECAPLVPVDTDGADTDTKVVNLDRYRRRRQRRRSDKVQTDPFQSPCDDDPA